jgi:hypothetical protein
MIREAGGVAVLAHPFSWETQRARLEAGLRTLKERAWTASRGLFGVIPRADADAARKAKRHGAADAGGSDYHGAPSRMSPWARARAGFVRTNTCLRS